MFIVIFKGILLGLLLSALIGPVFFLLIETSIRKGIKPALFLDFGVFISDIVYLILAERLVNSFHLSTEDVSQFSNDDIYLQVGGSIIFFIFGFLNIIPRKKKPSKNKPTPDSITKGGYLVLFFKGFILNIFNPFVLFYWLGVIVLVTSEYGFQGYDMIYFFCATLITFFSIDILKIIGARKLKPLVTPLILKRINQVTGLVLIGFGVMLFVKGVS